MKRSFALNTKPHVAEVGDVELLFKPEVMGDEFLDAYGRLAETRQQVGADGDDLSGEDPKVLRKITQKLRVFLAALMLPESARVFARWEVHADGDVVAAYGDPEEAEDAAREIEGARVVDCSMRLPDRILVDLMQWTVELYGSGGSDRPPTSSGGSVPASLRAGTPGRARSRSKV
ncbi:hypothetical protein GCM10010387_15430 [Streptomyces inusitatus]|uniref:Uncharacterized protein n=1 Tax=Streptomyces inusitatus TaxID=68221 RepID=A0A918PW93_9ACTN|nr:hypothetical protein [Streptomyces inusitatus]GGZ23234.1 hypothetical protein GCM10010387_15430 [Streptomyces inusitatus]